MQSEGIHLAPGQRLGSSNSPTTVIISGDSNYEMQPDGVIFFTTPAGEDYKVVVEVGVSQAYESLLEKARKWILDSECKIVLLLAFYEKERYAAPRKRITLTSQQVNDQVVQMRRRWPSTNVSEFSGLVFKGHTWLNEISEGFIDVIRKDRESDDTDALTNFKYILIDMGRDERSSVPASVGDIRLAELIPRESLGSAAGDIVVDFFNSDAFMDEVRTALISTAVTRFKKSVKLIV
ncbi:hypothetical protein V1520DRAFT_316147 [Lipomyces starkeyi]|uniref:Uncharacterized protein n=1 Tax=Lipomyces starkeyi NRRL Y-11557 TaxID=675824 RepID=A0A1E3PW60_LIPST|nr:hypothetical protein LIPSTDRAFT_192820 [Lipomyces starkeyi NRRL Y-11557]